MTRNPGGGSNKAVSSTSRALASSARQRHLSTMIVLLGAIVLSYVSILLYRPPSALGDEAPLNVFSAARAFRHVEEIARIPHPTGSPENDRVRDYLVAQLRSLGLDPVVDPQAEQPWPNSPKIPVQNVLARKAGTANTRAILFCVHHDSAPNAPGAGDDGAAVAALLETLRAVQSAPPLRNDLIVLSTDGEERGLLGAKGFMKEHPWAKELGLVCNFDARGSRGPSIMFETSRDNAGLIREFSRAVPRIIATSISGVVYERMPNGTDFTVFKRAGIPGLNFGYIEGVENYHQATNTPANLSWATLQHTGDIMLHLAMHFGNIELPVPSSGDAVYFNALGPWFVHYPENWAPKLGVILAVLGVTTAWILKRQGELRFGRLTASSLGLLLALAVAGLSGWAVLLLRAPKARFANVPGVYCFAALTVSLLVAYALSKWLARWVRPIEQGTSALLLWTGLAVFTAFKLQAGSYLFLWPTIIGWLALQTSFWFAPEKIAAPPYSPGAYVPLVLGPWCGIALISPFCALLWTALPSALPAITIMAIVFTWPLFSHPSPPSTAGRPANTLQ